MRKNIIFDLGHVLINFHPNHFVEKRVPKEKQNKIFDLIFQGQEWQDLDRGTTTKEKALESFIKKSPEEEELLRTIFPKYLMDCLSKNEENIRCIYSLKKRGYHLYVLSNFHRDLFEKIEKEWEMFREFDGGVISCYCQRMKPEQEIYEMLLTKYSLQPHDCIFIDDRMENIEVAKKLGIEGIHLPIQGELAEKIAFLLK